MTSLKEEIEYVMEAQQKLGLSWEFTQQKLTELLTGKKTEEWDGLIIDEEKEFKSSHAMSLRLSSATNGTHTNPSLYVRMVDSLGTLLGYADFNDLDTVKEIIEHIAKMCAFDVTITDKVKTGN